MSEDKATRIALALQTWRVGWEEGPTPQVTADVEGIRARYRELRGKKGFQGAALAAEVEYIEGVLAAPPEPHGADEDALRTHIEHLLARYEEAYATQGFEPWQGKITLTLETLREVAARLRVPVAGASEALRDIVEAYDAYRGRGMLPAPTEYAAVVAAIERSRSYLPPAPTQREEATETCSRCGGPLIHVGPRIWECADSRCYNPPVQAAPVPAPEAQREQGSEER